MTGQSYQQNLELTIVLIINVSCLSLALTQSVLVLVFPAIRPRILGGAAGYPEDMIWLNPRPRVVLGAVVMTWQAPSLPLSFLGLARSKLAKASALGPTLHKSQLLSYRHVCRKWALQRVTTGWSCSYRNCYQDYKWETGSSLLLSISAISLED